MSAYAPLGYQRVVNAPLSNGTVSVSEPYYHHYMDPNSITLNQNFRDSMSLTPLAGGKYVFTDDYGSINMSNITGSIGNNNTSYPK